MLSKQMLLALGLEAPGVSSLLTMRRARLDETPPAPIPMTRTRHVTPGCADVLDGTFLPKCSSTFFRKTQDVPKRHTHFRSGEFRCERDMPSDKPPLSLLRVCVCVFRGRPVLRLPRGSQANTCGAFERLGDRVVSQAVGRTRLYPEAVWCCLTCDHCGTNKPSKNSTRLLDVTSMDD